MRNVFSLALALALVAVPTWVGAQEVGETEGTLTIGAWDDSVDDSPALVAEYEPIDGGPQIGLDLVHFGQWGVLAFEAGFRGADDQDHSLTFDVKRMVRSHTEYTSLIHRLGKDSIAHFEGATDHGRVVQHSDLTTRDAFDVDYSRLDHRTEFQVPSLSALTLAFEYHDQQREGTRQQFNVSHCESCHVIAQDRPFEEETTSAVAEATVSWRNGFVRASAEQREYREEIPSITLLYDAALQPELRTPIFDDRLQFDSDEGALPVDQVPDIDKDIYGVDALFANVGGFALTAEGIWSDTDNLATGLSSNYNGYLLTASRNFADGWSFRWRGRLYSIESDDVFVTVNERVGVAGPAAGQTYQDRYGLDPNFLRRSSLDRAVQESKTDVTYRFGRKAGSVKGTWEWQTIDRDHYEVAPGRTETTTNTLGLSWWARPAKGWKTRLGFEHAEVQNPFLIVNGWFSDLFSAPAGGALDPNGTQYFQVHEARLGEGAASPASWDELTARASYSKGSSVLSGSYRWWDGDNDAGDFNDWSRSTQAATVTYFTSPAPQWEWHVAWAWNDMELKAPASVPIFDG